MPLAGKAPVPREAAARSSGTALPPEARARRRRLTDSWTCKSKAVQARTRVATNPSPTTSLRPLPATRHNAVRLVAYVSFHCFIVLGHACEMVELLPKHSSSSAHKQAADRTLAALWNRGLVDAVAAAAPSLAATIALVHSETGKRELYGSTTTTALTAGATEELSNCLVGAGHMATAVNRYLYLLAESLYYSLKGLSADGGPPALLQLPPEAVRALEALGDSQLLAAAATVLVDSPAASVLPGVRAKVCNRVLGGVQGGSKLVGVTLFCMQQMRWTLDAAGGPESRRLAGGLLRAMRHVAVRRLQAALLDQLAAHAGMGAELREDGSGLQGGQAGEEQQAGSVWEGGGWEGSIGVWWFAREEAQRGQLLALDPVVGDGGRGVGVGVGQHARNDATGLLEDRHCHIVYGAFGTWGGGVQEQAMAAAAGVPAGPPPLLAARLAARAAEALCRLCRGQGLGGAYAPAPRWQFAMAPVRRRALGATLWAVANQRTRLLPTTTATSARLKALLLTHGDICEQLVP